MDTKKKELVGDFKNAGREWHPKGKPPTVRVHDFQDDELGKAIPYGVYDLSTNAGWVSVGIDHDTPEFAVESIYCWWRQMGCKTYKRRYDGRPAFDHRQVPWRLELCDRADKIA